MNEERPTTSYPLNLGQPEGNDAAVSRESFYRKVRRVDATNPAWPRIGQALVPREELLRFRQVPHLIFAPATVARAASGAKRAGNREVEELMVYFMGMLGPSGPLPGVYTEVVLAKAKGVPHPDLRQKNTGESEYRADPGPAAFIDIFNHRFISFFYRAAVSANKAVDYDRVSESRFHSFIGSFLGLGTPEVQNRMDVPDVAALYFAGHFSAPTRHAEGLCKVIADYCGIETKLEPNVGHWVDVPPGDTTELGASRRGGGLGTGALLGSRFWDRTLKFRLVLGPMPLAKYETFAPGGTTLKAIRSFVLLYCGHELSCELLPVLKKDEVPPLELGRGSRLGFTSWLKSGPMAKDADEYHITLT